jgi:hypothetical protein
LIYPVPIDWTTPALSDGVKPPARCGLTIDLKRGQSNSALRLLVLDFYRKKLSPREDVTPK